jgi:MYXO-CTERM domain-containing protein
MSKSLVGRLGFRAVLVRVLSAAAFAAIAAAPNTAWALPNSTLEYSYYSAVQSYGAGNYSGAGYSVILSNSPSLELDSSWNSANTSFGGEQQWQAVVFDWVQVNGPTTGIVVPLDVTYSMTLSTAVSGGAYALAGARFTYDSDPNYTYSPIDISTGGYTDGSTSSGGTIAFNETTGTAFPTGFSVVETLYYAGGQASGVIDPVYSIDPSFASVDPNYLTDYSLSFSPNIQNAGPASSVPEAGSLPILAVGLAGLLMLTRFRRSRPAQAAL